MDKSITSFHKTYSNEELENIYNEQINTSNQNETNTNNCNKIPKIKAGYEFYKIPEEVRFFCPPSFFFRGLDTQVRDIELRKEIISLTFITDNDPRFAWYEIIQTPSLNRSKDINRLNKVTLYKEREKTIQEIQDNKLHSYIKTNTEGKKQNIFLKYLNTLEKEETIIPTIQKTILYTLALLQEEQHNLRFYIDLESIHNYRQLDIFSIFTQDYCNNFKKLYLKKPFPLYFMFKYSGKTITTESNFFMFIDTLSEINNTQCNKAEGIYLRRIKKSKKNIINEFINENLSPKALKFKLDNIKKDKRNKRLVKNHAQETFVRINRLLKNNKCLLNKDLNLRAFNVYLFCLSINITKVVKTNMLEHPNVSLCEYILDKLKYVYETGNNVEYNTDLKNIRETRGLADWEAEHLAFFELPTSKDFRIAMIDRGIELCEKPLLWLASCLLFYYCFKIFCPQYYASFLNIITIQEYNKSCLYTHSEIAS